MIGDEKYHPGCDGEASYKEFLSSNREWYIRLTDKSDPNSVWTCLNNNEILVGRSIDADIRFAPGFDDYIARRHCRILSFNDMLYIEDMGSANGTYVNGTVLEQWIPYKIVTGDEIKIGRHTFLFEQVDMVKL